MPKLLKQAFTLIELLVVIAIIGILSGLIVVSMGGMTQKATIAKAQVFSSSIKKSLMLNIVAEWKFNSSGINDGTIANSSYTQDSWNSNDAAIVTSYEPLVRSGNNCIDGSCLEFDGIDRLTTTVYPSTSGGISLWFYKIGGAAKVILGAHSVSPDVRAYVGVSDTNNFGGGVGSHGYSTLKGTTAIETNRWYHGVVTWNDSVEKLYLNGALEYSTTRAGAIPTTTYYYVACQNYNGADAIFNGRIDDIYIYNDIIPGSKIREDYYLGLNNLLSSGQINQTEYVSRINLIANE